MMRQAADINWADSDVAIPAFLTMVMMPFMYSIAVGIAWGVIVYVVMKIGQGKMDELNTVMLILAALLAMFYLGPGTETTFEFLRGRPHAPQGAAWDTAVEAWSQLRTDDGAEFDTEVYLDASTLSPFVTWGTNPGQGVPLAGSVPDPELMLDEGERQSAEKALAYMDLRPGMAMRDITVDTVFVGSCTNGRIEDLRVVADVLRGRRVAEGVRMLVVPGSMRVRAQAEAEGLGEVFTAAGAEWRQAGCSMCLGMNPDQLSPGQRCASTSNRNFEGRQGKGGRTHLVSPAVAAATAVLGALSSPADLPAAPAR